MVVDAIVSIALYKPLGIAGLVIGTAAANLVMTVLQLWRLRIGFNGYLEGGQTLMITVRILVGTSSWPRSPAASGFVLDHLLGRSLPAQIFSVGIACAVACAAIRQADAHDARARGPADPGADHGPTALRLASRVAMGLYERHFSNPPARARVPERRRVHDRVRHRPRDHARDQGRRIGPFHNISEGGRHIHHSTFGILGLLGIGYVWTQQVAVGIRAVRALAVARQRDDVRGRGRADARRVRAVARPPRRLLG